MIASCAVLDDNQVLGEYSLNQAESHSEKLVPMIKEVLDSLNLKINDIDLYAVAIGPGSFTGLRIGVATIKSFAHLFDKPVVGISTLEGLAFNLPYNKILVPMIDARRNRVYTGIYTWDKDEIKTIKSPDVIDIDELLEEINSSYDEIVVNGEGSNVYQEKIKGRLGDKVSFAGLGQNFCRATSIGELGLIKYNNGHQDNYYTIVPEYLRETQAQRELDERKNK